MVSLFDYLLTLSGLNMVTLSTWEVGVGQQFGEDPRLPRPEVGKAFLFVAERRRGRAAVSSPLT